MKKKKFKLRRVKNGTKIIVPKGIKKVKIIKLLDNEKSQIVIDCDDKNTCITRENLSEGSVLILDNGTIIVGKEDISIDEVYSVAERLIELYEVIDSNPVNISYVDEFVETVLRLLLYSANARVDESVSCINKLIDTIELIEGSELPQFEEIDYIDKILHSKLKKVGVLEYKKVGNTLLIRMKGKGILMLSGENKSIDRTLNELCASLNQPPQEPFIGENQAQEPDYFQYQEPEQLQVIEQPKELPDEIREELSKVFE